MIRSGLDSRHRAHYAVLLRVLRIRYFFDRRVETLTCPRNVPRALTYSSPIGIGYLPSAILTNVLLRKLQSPGITLRVFGGFDTTAIYIP